MKFLVNPFLLRINFTLEINFTLKTQFYSSTVCSMSFTSSRLLYIISQVLGRVWSMSSWPGFDQRWKQTTKCHDTKPLPSSSSLPPLCLDCLNSTFVRLVGCWSRDWLLASWLVVCYVIPVFGHMALYLLNPRVLWNNVQYKENTYERQNFVEQSLILL